MYVRMRVCIGMRTLKLMYEANIENTKTNRSI